MRWNSYLSYCMENCRERKLKWKWIDVENSRKLNVIKLIVTCSKWVMKQRDLYSSTTNNKEATKQRCWYNAAMLWKLKNVKKNANKLSQLFLKYYLCLQKVWKVHCFNHNLSYSIYFLTRYSHIVEMVKSITQDEMWYVRAHK
jgi:hypothetical protein